MFESDFQVMSLQTRATKKVGTFINQVPPQTLSERENASSKYRALILRPMRFVCHKMENLWIIKNKKGSLCPPPIEQSCKRRQISSFIKSLLSTLS